MAGQVAIVQGTNSFADKLSDTQSNDQRWFGR